MSPRPTPERGPDGGAIGGPDRGARPPWGWLAATGVVLAVAYGPMLVWFCQDLWEKTHYQHFPFVLTAAVGLFVTRYAEASSAAAPGAWGRFAGVLTVGAWCALAAALFGRSPWLAACSLFLLFGALLFRVRGSWRVSQLIGVWLIPWLILPLPLGKDVWLITKLQSFSSRLSSGLLDQLGVLHLMDGNALRLPDKEFFVDEACSGVVSVMSIIAAAWILGVWRRRTPWQTVLITASGVVWAVLLNVVRITLIACLYDWYGVDLSEGTPHTLLGLALFSVTFGALVSTDQLLLGLTAPVSRPWREQTGSEFTYGGAIAAAWDRLAPGEASPEQEPPVARPSRLLTATRLRPMALGLFWLFAFGAVGLAQFGTEAWMNPSDADPVEATLERAMALTADDLPERIAGWRQVEFWEEHRDRQSVFGAESRLYRYESPEHGEVLVSIDFPFDEQFHTLDNCYTGIGWLRVSQRNLDVPDPRNERPWTYVELFLDRPTGEQAAVLYCSFDEYGGSGSPRGVGLLGEIQAVFERRRDQASRRSYQVQVWMPARQPEATGQVEAATELLLSARELFRDLLVPQRAPHSNNPG